MTHSNLYRSIVAAVGLATNIAFMPATSSADTLNAAQRYARDNPNAAYVALSAQYYDNKSAKNIPTSNTAITSSDPFGLEGKNILPLGKVAHLIPDNLFLGLLGKSDNYVNVANHCNASEERKRGSGDYGNDFIRQEFLPVEYGVAEKLVKKAFNGVFDKKKWDVFPGRDTQFYLQMATSNVVAVDPLMPGVTKRVKGEFKPIPASEMSLEDKCLAPRN